MAGIKTDDSDSSPYSMMFLNNAIQNEENTVEHMSGKISTSSTNHENILSQAKGGINKNWLLIENQSKVHVFCNPKLLKNIQRMEQTVHIL